MINRIRLRYRIRRRNVDPYRHLDGYSNRDFIGNFDANRHFDFDFADLAHGDLVVDGDFAVDAFWTGTTGFGGVATGSGTGSVSAGFGFGFGGVTDLLSGGGRVACWSCWSWMR